MEMAVAWYWHMYQFSNLLSKIILIPFYLGNITLAIDNCLLTYPCHKCYKHAIICIFFTDFWYEKNILLNAWDNGQKNKFDFFLFVSDNVLLLLFQFLQWKPPSWIYESEVIMGKSIFSVSETALSKNFYLLLVEWF